MRGESVVAVQTVKCDLCGVRLPADQAERRPGPPQMLGYEVFLCGAPACAAQVRDFVRQWGWKAEDLRQQLIRDGWAMEEYYFSPTWHEERILDRLEDFETQGRQTPARFLVRHEIAQLPEGAYVWVRWADGQGPHVYRLTRQQGGVWLQHRDTILARQRGVRLPLETVGSERWQTRVWVA